MRHRAKPRQIFQNLPPPRNRLHRHHVLPLRLRDDVARFLAVPPRELHHRVREPLLLSLVHRPRDPHRRPLQVLQRSLELVEIRHEPGAAHLLRRERLPRVHLRALLLRTLLLRGHALVHLRHLLLDHRPARFPKLFQRRRHDVNVRLRAVVEHRVGEGQLDVSVYLLARGVHATLFDVRAHGPEVHGLFHDVVVVFQPQRRRVDGLDEGKRPLVRHHLLHAREALLRDDLELPLRGHRVERGAVERHGARAAPRDVDVADASSREGFQPPPLRVGRLLRRDIRRD
eukprot:30941-Pelagococcus_subviridis.AAC.13